MDLRYLRKLMEIFDTSSATDLAIEEEGIKIKISKNMKNYGKESNIASVAMIQPTAVHTPIIQSQPTQIDSEIPTTIPQIADLQPKAEDIGNHHIIKSPIVGTFYRSPSPEMPAYIEVGSHVNIGNVLCIVEAMKLMNEIESDISGTIEKIYVENAKPVEYNQPLFSIKPD
jgi:acetyl-CoA carboxylase biotin carboxyl carrier protein